MENYVASFLKGNVENEIVDHGNETHLIRLHKSENNECQYICTYMIWHWTWMKNDCKQGHECDN